MARAERSDEAWTQLATRIPKALHQELKLHCVEADTSVRCARLPPGAAQPAAWGVPYVHTYLGAKHDRRFTHADMLRCHDAAIALAEAAEWRRELHRV